MRTHTQWGEKVFAAIDARTIWHSYLLKRTSASIAHQTQKLDWDRRTNVKSEVMKLQCFLKENIGEYLHDLEVGKDFFDRIQKALIIKNHTLDIIKVKFFCLSNDTIKKMKSQTTDWGMYLQSLFLTKNLLSRIDKNFYKSVIKRQLNSQKLETAGTTTKWIYKPKAVYTYKEIQSVIQRNTVCS